MENKIFLGLGVLAVIGGILLVLEQKYLVGISGSVVGLWLILQNVNKIRGKDSN